MIHLILNEKQDAYEVVANIIDNAVDKIYDYCPCCYIVKLGYKYSFEYESERVICNEYYFNNGDISYWENDWCEGQTDIIIYGFTALDEVEIKHTLGEE